MLKKIVTALIMGMCTLEMTGCTLERTEPRYATGTRSPYATNMIEAGPLWNRAHAKKICPQVCEKNNLEWKGEWHTTIWGKMSVCHCEKKAGISGGNLKTLHPAPR